MKKLALSQTHFAVTPGSKITGELVINPSVSIRIASEEGLSTENALLSAGKISGSFHNESVTIGNKTYQIEIRDNQVFLKK